MKNTPVTSAIFLCELNWTPFVQRVNDPATTNRRGGGFAHARRARHAPANLSHLLPSALEQGHILRQEKFTHKAHGPGPISLGAAVGSGTSDGFYEEGREGQTLPEGG